jgi:uncharacterized membrane protein YcaP (DUF421 family)
MDVVVRVAIIYLFLFAAMRVMGKREFSQLAPMELVSLLLIPEIVSSALVGGDASLTGALIGLSTLFVLVFGVSTLTHLSPRAGTALDGSPVVLAHRGAFVRAHLDRERLSPEEVYGELRKHGLERIDQVRWAILETDGTISIVPEERAPLAEPEASLAP